jgi:outer membrane protein assembly factor BamA
MRLTRLFCFFIVLLIIPFGHVTGQDPDEKPEKNEEKVKTGWTFGALPTISFDTDVGFQYGLLANFFNYGDGTTYPEYLQSIYLEWSRTTKGSGINRFYFDSEHLIPKIRLTADVSYLTEQTMQFFGFNGYDAVYNSQWEDESSPEYISRAFYRHDRKIFRIMTSFQGKIIPDNDSFRSLAGFAYYDNKIGSVDIDKLNKGKGQDEALPDTVGLYDKYVEWGVISEDESKGNKTTYLKAGLVYDSRDFEAFPTRGIWAEAIFSYAPSFLGDGKFEYSKLTLLFRQYLPIGSEKLVLAYRLIYQGTMSGTVPFHMQPHIVPTIMTAATSQGLGGSKSLRGIMRNRVVGDGFVLGNAELRWKFLNTVVFKQNLYLGTNLFADVGKVVDKIDVNPDFQGQEVDEDDFFAYGSEGYHVSAGIGLKIGLNENFVVSADYGLATDNRDGESGLYITLNWLY